MIGVWTHFWVTQTKYLGRMKCVLFWLTTHTFVQQTNSVHTSQTWCTSATRILWIAARYSKFCLCVMYSGSCTQINMKPLSYLIRHGTLDSNCVLGRFPGTLWLCNLAGEAVIGMGMMDRIRVRLLSISEAAWKRELGQIIAYCLKGLFLCEIALVEFSWIKLETAIGISVY